MSAPPPPTGPPQPGQPFPPGQPPREDNSFKAPLVCFSIIDILLLIGDFCVMAFAVWCIQCREKPGPILVGVFGGVIILPVLVVYISVLCAILASNPNSNVMCVFIKLIVMPVYWGLMGYLIFPIATVLVFMGVSNTEFWDNSSARSRDPDFGKGPFDVFRHKEQYPMRRQSNVIALLIVGYIYYYCCLPAYLLISWSVLVITQGARYGFANRIAGRVGNFSFGNRRRGYPAYGQPGYGQGYGPGYGQGYAPGYGQGYGPGYGQGYGQGPGPGAPRQV